ncbi:hypothetical protein C2845_PM16G07070 [Panicum miliaceum]|uniref:RRM domain-containing protein n=1 Tax=Panicum miliaceum TaxID=4540 RepID=A0A3L6PWF3_PANMI|nr:hypothetical protein C2845_PM16G07070 [Panicum miliaceum]
MNAAHGHSRGHATCSYELGLVPSPPAVSHTPRARPQQNRNDSASRLLPHGLALFPLAPRKGAAMAMAALRGASRCLASRGSAAAARPMLVAHSRGITYKLFIGGLSHFATEDSLAEAFSRYGQVIEATIVTDEVTNRPKGFGFVKFASEEEANNAREEMNGKARC